jgi:hypothetical protein
MIEQTSDSEVLTGIDPSAVYELPSGFVAKLVSPKRDDVMSVGDEAALIGFFGVSTYERSTFGAIVDHLMYTAMGSHDCARCAGAGVLNDGGFRVEDKCRQCKGEGYEPGATKACSLCRGTRREPPYRVELKQGGWCGSCSGTGAAGIDRRGSKPPACGSCPGKRKTRVCKNCGACKACRDARACRDCRNCLGTGVEPVSVHQTGEEGATGREGADEGQLTKYALTSRRLQRVRDKSPALFRALVAYYGEKGEHWGLTDRGRIFALYAETSAGKQLVKLTRRERGNPWKNPTPTIPSGTPEGEAPLVLKQMWERVAAEDARPTRCKVCRDRQRVPAFNSAPGVHTVQCAACATFSGPVQRRSGFLSAAPPSEHGIELPKNPDGSAKHMTHAEIIAQVGDEERNSSSPRRQLFTEAGKQARQLYGAAVVAWNEARRGRQTRASRALVKRATKLGLTNLASHIADTSGSK